MKMLGCLTSHESMGGETPPYIFDLDHVTLTLVTLPLDHLSDIRLKMNILDLGDLDCDLILLLQLCIF